ncbi:MAG TPA: NfeD family protein [Atribacteraceae bacterium]|nr:NfeD family protein [Atribacteraceae bacterium]
MKSFTCGFGFVLRAITKALPVVLLIVMFLLFVPVSLLAQSPVYWVPLKDVPDFGAVEWGLASFARRALQEAEQAGAEMVIFEIDTFGGRVDAMLFIKDAILRSPLKTVAFINSKAWSAGVFIALAAEIIIMSPDASIGAAEPRGGLEEAEGPDPKMVSAIRAQIEALAETRGRDPEIFAAMVDRGVEIPGLVKAGELLTLTATQAVEHGAADGVARNRQEVLDFLRVSAPVVTVEPSWSETLARILTHPTIIPILLMIAFGGIFMEMMAPGFGFPGAVGVTALILFFGGRFLAGLAGWEPLLLFLLGIILLAIELLVLPGFGVAGISGIASLTVSLYLVLRTTTILLPEVVFGQLFFYIALLAGVFLVFLTLLPDNPIWKRIGLYKKLKDRVVPEEEKLNYRTLVGKPGRAVTVLRPSGIMEIDGKRYDVVSQGDFVSTGETVVVVEVHGNRIVVRPERGE